jgi:glycosyltransferase involved in cell wall biosynthesis
MTVLLVHNHYRQPGGEDEVFAAEASLLEAGGERVVRYITHNDQAAVLAPWALAGATTWNGRIYREVRDICRLERPRVAHFHNTFPLISPAAWYAASAANVPVVQTLHNYRLLCPNALFFRDGHVCEECAGHFVPWPSVVHACYRGNRAATAAVAAMLASHRVLGTWAQMTDVYIALTDFARQKFIQGGLPQSKLVVKPNFVYPDPGPGESRGEFALFVGRLSAEKGVKTLLAAWEQLHVKVPLIIVGHGPLASGVVSAAERGSWVTWLGKQSKSQVFALMKQARILLVPSICYENLPMVVVEAYAAGRAVLASNLGSLSSLIDHGRTGLHVRPNDPADLAAATEWAWGHPGEMAAMGREARHEFEQKYTAERNHEMLLEIYRVAEERARQC